MRLFVLCLLLALLPTHVVSQNSKAKPDKYKDNSSSAARSENPTPQVVIQSQSNQQSANQQNAPSEKPQHRFLPGPEWISAGGTLLIFVVTTAYTIVSYCILRRMGRQTHEMKRHRSYLRLSWIAMKDQAIKMERQLAEMEKQANAAVVAADAAKLSAKSAVNAERAWVRPRIEQSDHSKPFGSYELKAANDGKTPAHVTGYALGARRVPVKPGEPGPHVNEPIIPVNVWINGRDDKTVAEFNILHLDIPGEGQRQPGVTKMIFHGWVEYIAVIEHDSSAQPIFHRTTFAYDWDPNSADLGYKPYGTRYT